MLKDRGEKHIMKRRIKRKYGEKGKESVVLRNKEHKRET